MVQPSIMHGLEAEDPDTVTAYNLFTVQNCGEKVMLSSPLADPLRTSKWYCIAHRHPVSQ